MNTTDREQHDRYNRYLGLKVASRDVAQTQGPLRSAGRDDLADEAQALAIRIGQEADNQRNDT